MATSPLILDRNGAVFERHTYRNDGLELVTWVVRPPGSGPFPLLVINHGSAVGMANDGTLTGDPSQPTIDPENPVWARLAANGTLTLLPEGRGYGGSEGENALTVIRRGIDATFAMLQGRAADANAAAEWAIGRPDVDGARCAIAGASHGGVVTLLAASQRAYGAAVAQATGAAYGPVEASIRPLANAAARITAPLLFQHMRTDTLVLPQGARHIFDWSSRFRPQQRWREYPGVSGVQGHDFYAPANATQWGTDYVKFLRAGFAAAPSPPADPPEQWMTLDFLLPGTLRPDAPRWAGRFGGDGPDAMVVLDGEHAAYAWKDENSRGHGEGPVTHRGDVLMFDPWPHVTITLAPLPGDAFQATYQAGRGQYTTRLDRVS